MARWVECVPNFSEGRDKDKVDRLCEALTQVKGVTLLDREMDRDHNRSVLTIVGPPDEVGEAVFRAIEVAAQIIDLNTHTGQHPRMGATDVVPFVPLEGTTMEDCVALARGLAQRVGTSLEIPTYLYERAATRPDREDLANVRQGQFEGLRDLIGTDPRRDPDFGPRRIHPTAGATAIGARTFLIAYNINLATHRIEVADRIAKAIRARSGGFRHVKAKGFYLADRGIAQVSMNLVNFQETPLHRVFLTVREEAARYGAQVLESEIVGLVPQEALVMAGAHLVQLSDGFSMRQVLENRLAEAGTEPQATMVPFLDRVAAATPAPGGGSVSALAGALGASLVAMVAGLTAGKKKFAAVAAGLTEKRIQVEALRRRLTDLVEEDAAAFEAMMKANRMPAEPEQRARERAKALRLATEGAIEAPLGVMTACRDVLALARDVARDGSPLMASDAGVAAHMALAGVRGAHLNVRVNLGSLAGDPAAVETFTRRARVIVDEAESLSAETLRLVDAKLG